MSTKRLSPLFTWRSAVCDKDSGLKPTRRLVALALSLHMSERGDSAFPSLQTIADESGLSKSTVITCLDDLESAGYLDRDIGGGAGNPTRYSALIPKQVDSRTVSERSEEQRDDQTVPPLKESDSRTDKGAVVAPKETDRSPDRSSETVQLSDPNCPTDGEKQRDSRARERTEDEEQDARAPSSAPKTTPKTILEVRNALGLELVNDQPLRLAAINQAMERLDAYRAKNNSFHPNPWPYARRIAIDEHNRIINQERAEAASRERAQRIERCPNPDCSNGHVLDDDGRAAPCPSCNAGRPEPARQGAA